VETPARAPVSRTPDPMWRDLVLAARSLGRARAFSAAAILTLALGVGATSAIFSVVHAVLLEALPFREPERLLVLRGEVRREEVIAGPIGVLDIASLREETRGTFAALVPISSTRHFNLGAPGGDGEVEHVSGEMTDERFFALFGLAMTLGRGFTAEEVAPPGVPVVVLSHALWERRYGRSPDVIGRTLVLNELSYTIVGVAAPGFAGFGDQAQLWLPIGMSHRLYGAHYTDMRQFRWISAVARLAPGVSAAQAAQALQLASWRLAQAFPKENDRLRYVATPLVDVYVGDQRRSLWSMFAAAGLVLLIGCANIANLLLARALARRREFAVRVALGAGRARLVRQVLAESLVLGGAGLALGLGLAVAGARTLVASRAIPLASFTHVEVDAMVIGVTVALTLLCTVGFGLVPAFVALRVTPKAGMGDDARGATAGRTRARLQRTLIAAEVAVAALLLTGATVMTKGFAGFRRTDVGFTADGLLTLRVDLTAERYRTNEPVWGLLARVLEEGRAVPGVQALAVEGPGLPTSGWYQITVTRPGASGEAEEFPARRHHVSPGYRATLGIPLLAGRDLGAQDVAGAERAILVGERLARRLWPGESPLGRTVHTTGPTPVPLTVVGVVRDVSHGGLEVDGST
jgi:predicted permease